MGNPRIGITFSPRRPPAYYEPYMGAVRAAGAEPVLLSPTDAGLDGIDGLLLPGGWDVDPALYGEEPSPDLGPVDRELDEAEIGFLKQAQEHELPVLGICRGQQVINVALGGTLQQHLEDHDVRAQSRSHFAHPIQVQPGSELGSAARSTDLLVNSLHHQAVKSLAPGLLTTAQSPDGVVEGLESEDGRIVAVQCHPEELVGDLSWARALFERFISRAGDRRRSETGTC